MNLECPHPSYDSMEAHLHATSVRHSSNANGLESSLAQTIENHLFVCETCQEVAESELSFATLIRRSLVAHDVTLCRRRKHPNPPNRGKKL